MSYVIRARVSRIDPPFWLTADGKQPSFIQDTDISSPALLNVIEVYKGPPMATLEVAIGGYCFSPAACTDLPYNFTWADVSGYDLILFVVDHDQLPGRPVFPTRAYPFHTYVVNPDPSKDEAALIHFSRLLPTTLSKLVSDIRNAPTSNH
jgi:hypothetical protein